MTELHTDPQDPNIQDTQPPSLIGAILDGEVTHITAFGAFVRLSTGDEGLVHISEIANEYVTDINQFVKVGDTVKVKVLAKNAKNKLELSMRKTKDEDEPQLFLQKKTKNSIFEDRLSSFLKKSEEKQIDIRRNLKTKHGVTKKKK